MAKVFERKIVYWALVIIMVLSWSAAGTSGEEGKKNVLIYTKNGEGYVHDNIAASVECLKKICSDKRWDCETTDDAGIFTAEKIGEFDVLVFSNTNNETFDTQEQRKVFQEYI